MTTHEKAVEAARYIQSVDSWQSFEYHKSPLHWLNVTLSSGGGVDESWLTDEEVIAEATSLGWTGAEG